MSHPETLSRIRLLVIDDERKLGLMVKRRLEHTGRYEVEVAESGAAGLARARAQRFDAVLTDLRMPGMDGAAVLRALKQEQPDTPVLLMSVYHDDSEVMTPALIRDADAVVAKPIDRDQLTRAIESLVRRGTTP